MPQSEADKPKVVVITGGGRGIGLAMARLFAHAGFKVAVTGRDESKLKAVVAAEETADITGMPCDVTDPASV